MADAAETITRCLVDTNVLIYATIDAAPRCEEAGAWLTRLQGIGTRLCITPQYREYLVVLTRGSAFDRTFSVDEALVTVEQLRPAFAELLRLVRRYDVRGKQIHDANIVAVMKTPGVEQLATYNRGDFQRFDEITLLSP